MNIDLLTSGQAEAVSLSEQGMTITEYLYSFTSSEGAPATMMVNTANSIEIRESLSSPPVEAMQNGNFKTSGQVRVIINDTLTDNDMLLINDNYVINNKVTYPEPITVKPGQSLNIKTTEVE